jgi:heat shock protein HtpX
MQAYGLYTHIRANRIRTVYLLASFVFLLIAVLYSLTLIVAAFQGDASTAEILLRARSLFARSWPWALIGAGAWFAIAWTFHQVMIDHAMGARALEPSELPEVHRVLENLCISRGITTPQLRVIDSDALNAFASGMKEGSYSIGVTRGLAAALTPAELEAVLAHELTHIRNRDTQVMVVATIFAGIIAFVADLTVRNWNFPFGWAPRRQSRDDDDRRSGSGGAMIAIAVAIGVIAISWGLSVLIRFAISRKREFLADAGSVELTKNPDAMISALRKIEAHAAMPAMPSRMEGFFIETPAVAGASDWLSTHPSMAARIDALVRYGGGRDPGPYETPAPTAPAAPPGPWGPAPPQSNA